MAKKEYGVTIWGREFLLDLENSTDSGRLARGKTYANTGRVYDIKLTSNSLSAKVEGNYEPYYNVSINFHKLTEAQIKTILKIIDENPMVLASIMNGKLDEHFLRLLHNKQIPIFEDFDMGCNCYDFYGRVACKHIAGLYFILVSEIDKNPFILFNLRGLDLIKHYNISSELKIKYPIKLEYLTENKNIEIEDSVEILKFSDFSNFILSMLSDKPPFAEVNYREALEEFYKKTSRELALRVSPMQNEKIDKIERLLQDSDFEFRMSGESLYHSYFKISNPLLKDNLKLFDGYILKYFDGGFDVSPIELFNLFISFEDDNGTNSYKYLFYLFRVAYILIDNNAFIPSIAVDKDISFNIIYKPLSSTPEVFSQIQKLAKLAPKMINFRDKDLNQLSTTEVILSSVISEFVKSMNFMHKKLKNTPPLISYSFFRGERYQTKNFEDKNIAQTIYNYFAVFDISKHKYNYKIYIDKSEDEYILTIKVKDENEYLLREAINSLNRMEILKLLSFLNNYIVEIEELLSVDVIKLSRSRLEEFLLKTSNIISNLGMDIILPKELKNLLKPKLSLSVSSSSKGNLQSFFSLDKILEYDWQIAIGDEKISVSEFEKLVQSGSELIKFKDNFVVLSAEEAKNIFAQIKKKQKLNKFDILQAKLNGEASFDSELNQFIDSIFEVKDINIPTTLQANLREYQTRGVSWSINNLLNGFGTILADDMGLGKTIQAITTILYLKENEHLKNRVMVIVPTSLLNNWENEIEKFAPTLSYFSYYGLKRVIKESDILITTYDIARRDLEKLKKEKIDCLIIDEAQKIKNPDTSTTKAIKSLKAKYKIALSGTPVENNLSELWSIFDFSLPKYLKSLKDFNQNYAKDIEINKDMQKIEKLKRVTAPFMLRRLKTDRDIISDLPEKIVIDEYATMTKEQASLYQSVVNESFKEMNEENSAGLIFKLIISLKQICNHPRNFDKSSDKSSKLSGKSELLLTLLENILDRDEKVLIFTQYTEMVDILVDMIENELFSTPLYLKGSMSKKKRDEIVDEFQNNQKYKIFILSLKAGGVGLNLTSANHVIHYDLWFNPAVENQATDRAFRIGQSKNVSVYRFITKNSFEEKIDKMIKAKQELSDLSVNIGENWLADMDKEELKGLFC